MYRNPGLVQLLNILEDFGQPSDATIGTKAKSLCHLSLGGKKFHPEQAAVHNRFSTVKNSFLKFAAEFCWVMRENCRRLTLGAQADVMLHHRIMPSFGMKYEPITLLLAAVCWPDLWCSYFINTHILIFLANENMQPVEKKSFYKSNKQINSRTSAFLARSACL